MRERERERKERGRERERVSACKKCVLKVGPFSPLIEHQHIRADVEPGANLVKHFYARKLPIFAMS